MGVIGDLYYEYLLDDREENKNPTADKLEATEDKLKSCSYGICSECKKEKCINNK